MCFYIGFNKYFVNDVLSLTIILPLRMSDNKNRCEWCLKDKTYMDYHDNIWGVPVFDDIKLFEYLNLEGAQAGLSWYTILCRIESYKNAFSNWDPQKIIQYDDKDIHQLLNNPGIIRNKLKVRAVVGNAKAYLELKEQQKFSDYLWNFVDGKPIVNHWMNINEIPGSTQLSETISKDLRKKGFKFVGPTIVYAFMQAVGMVDDHVMHCWKRNL